MVVEKRKSNVSDNYFFGDSPTGTANQKLALGYSLNGKVIHAQGSNSYTANVSSYEDSKDKSRTFTFVSDSATGKKTYINGVLAAESSDTTKLSGITSLAIGKSYRGEIGEIAIFTRALRGEERKSVEDYGGKKWTVKINRDVVAGGSCTTGTVTDSGCSMDCSTSSFAGISSPSSVTDGQTVTATCGQLGFGGTTSVTCANGNLSGSACSCASGYTLSGGACVAQCAVSIAGVSSTTPVGIGSGTLTCNATHYNGATINYTCASGTLTPSGSCACATGYTGSSCSTCDTGYTASGSDCISQCAVSVAGVTSTAPVGAGSGTLTCNATNYNGSTINYTCAAGTLTPSASCSCATGYAGAGCSTCDSGYLMVSGSCQSSCNVGTITGVATTAVPQGSGSLPCNASGYYGVINYTCASNGTFTPTGSCNQACSGGTLDSTTVPGTVIHKFTSVGTATFTCPTAKNVSVLVVAGGGGGGGSLYSTTAPQIGGGGGGGAGGVIYNASFAVSTSPVTVTVGAGGAGGATKDFTLTPGNNGTNGSSSAFSTISASGGGGGAGMRNGGLGGASGGGGGGKDAGTAAGSRIAGQGNVGATGNGSGGGVGGGASANGVAASSVSGVVYGGVGGAGIQYNISGVSTYYGGGGAGGFTVNGFSSCTSTCGTALGGSNSGGNYGSPGVANTGGGGGASFYNWGAGNAGGGGVVIVSYN